MYKIILPNFEGPFDLLLYFIKRDELNIYDIPISKITEEFLKYIRLMQFFDLELAGEFLVMAATLMYIKSQLLLPREDKNEDGEIEDPRTQLVQRLIEYKQFKSAAHELYTYSEENKYVYYRKLFDSDANLAENSGDIYYKNATLFDLLNAVNKFIARNKAINDNKHIVKIFPITIEEKVAMIYDLLKTKTRFSFFKLFSSWDRQHIVTTFVAILELIKRKEIYIQQENNFDDIIISKRPKDNDALDQLELGLEI